MEMNVDVYNLQKRMVELERAILALSLSAKKPKHGSPRPDPSRAARMREPGHSAGRPAGSRPLG
jgi:hypothetical protein